MFLQVKWIIHSLIQLWYPFAKLLRNGNCMGTLPTLAAQTANIECTFAKFANERTLHNMTDPIVVLQARRSVRGK